MQRWLLCGFFALDQPDLVRFTYAVDDSRRAPRKTRIPSGLRGGGGSFGVATCFECRLHSVGPILGGLIVHPFNTAGTFSAFYREFAFAASDELTCFSVLGATP